MVRRGNFEGGGDQTFAAEHAKTKTPPPPKKYCI